MAEENGTAGAIAASARHAASEQDRFRGSRRGPAKRLGGFRQRTAVRIVLRRRLCGGRHHHRLVADGLGHSVDDLSGGDRFPADRAVHRSRALRGQPPAADRQAAGVARNSRCRLAAAPARTRLDGLRDVVRVLGLDVSGAPAGRDHPAAFVLLDPRPVYRCRLHHVAGLDLPCRRPCRRGGSGTDPVFDHGDLDPAAARPRGRFRDRDDHQREDRDVQSRADDRRGGFSSRWR